MDPQDEMLDVLDLGLARFDRSMRLVDWNRTLFDMMGYPRRFATKGTRFLDFVAFNIARGEHGEAPPGVIVRQRLACRYRNYSRRRTGNAVLNVTSRRLDDGGFVKLFALSPPDTLDPALSPRETEVLQWAANGKTAAETAIILGVSERTVEFHIANAVTRLGAANKLHAVALAVAAGRVRPTPPA